MPVTTTTTVRTTTEGVAVHTISFRGLCGAIFLCLTVSAVLYVIGFATLDWKRDNNRRVGLWETCQQIEGHELNEEDWFHAVQAMISIGLIGLFICISLACVYMCVHTVSKNATILALIIFCFLSVVFMLVGFIVFGAYVGDKVHWSFGITVIASAFCLIAGILSIVQMRRSGVRV